MWKVMKFKHARINGSSNYDSLSQGSQMPRHVVGDAREWINEIPTVPVYYLAKAQRRERVWDNQRGKQTLLSLTPVRLCEMTYEV